MRPARGALGTKRALPRAGRGGEGAGGRPFRGLAAAVALALGAAGCSDLTITRPVDAIPVAIAHPSFSRDIQPILTETCASSTACHSGATPQAGLNLSPSLAFTALVDVPATFAPDLRRVRPSRPDSSFVLMMLGENAARRRGARRMPLTSLPLPAPVIETIRNWIADGAPRN